MTSQLSLPVDPERIVRERFSAAGIPLSTLERRDYPEETILIVRVPPDALENAAHLGNALDRELHSSGFDGFVVVRPLTDDITNSKGRLEGGIADARALELVNLLTARSRTSEIQPSLSYVRDSAQNLLRAITPRHHLIFGRRGAGKTALMVETKRLADQNGHLSVWINIQTHRRQTAATAYLWTVKTLLDMLSGAYRGSERAPAVLAAIAKVTAEVDAMVGASDSEARAASLVPRVHSVVKRFLESTGSKLFVFLDDLHYLDRSQQPVLLDMVHGTVRDCDAWLKISAIKHLSQWFIPQPPTGLQTGHDADHIDLDLTLENPSEAKVFLERVLKAYANHLGISSIGQIFSGDALDRLVLAAGAVPRDYLTLSAASIRQAQRRQRGRLVGIQDVNKAAGENAKVKITELEDDAAASQGSTEPIVKSLDFVRSFCLDQKRFTYFRIDFRDREEHVGAYSLMQDLMDLRLIHLVSSSLSDEHEAGRRSEVFLLDLSQYSGERLKRHLKVLDFHSGHLVLKDTGTTTQAKRGDSPRKLLGLLRRGPLFQLRALGTETLHRGSLDRGIKLPRGRRGTVES